MPKTYHVFTLSVGKEGVERVYVREGVGTREDAEKALKRSQRRRILFHRIARPTSFYEELAKAQGTSFPLPVGRRRKKERRAGA